jgi:hypothetical protein
MVGDKVMVLDTGEKGEVVGPSETPYDPRKMMVRSDKDGSLLSLQPIDVTQKATPLLTELRQIQKDRFCMTKAGPKHFIVSAADDNIDMYVRILRLGHKEGNEYFDKGAKITLVRAGELLLRDPGLAEADFNTHELKEFLHYSSIMTYGMLIMAWDPDMMERWLVSRHENKRFLMIPDIRLWVCTYQGVWPLRKDGYVFYGTRDETTNKPDGDGTAFFYDTGRYSGSWEQGSMDGWGVMRYGLGDIYTGDWKENKKMGLGRMLYKNGNSYNGGWRKNRKDGLGTMTYARGDRYVGGWQLGKKHGSGTYSFVNGNVYTGQFEHDKKHGHGTMKWANGNTYTGQFEMGEYNGQGTMMFANKASYTGGWADGRFHGQGTLISPERDTYTGTFVDGVKCGQASHSFKNRDVYTGEYDDDARHGQGIMKYGKGDTYEGSWKRGKRHGMGSLSFLDGRVYEGGWKEDKMFGDGTVTHKNGEVKDVFDGKPVIVKKMKDQGKKQLEAAAEMLQMETEASREKKAKEAAREAKRLAKEQKRADKAARKSRKSNGSVGSVGSVGDEGAGGGDVEEAVDIFASYGAPPPKEAPTSL